MALALFTDSRFGRWLSRICPLPGSSKKPTDPRHALGVRGEKLAARWLRRNRYRVLYRNFRARGGGEVDIVCRHKDTLVFVEVKTRATEAFGRPGEAVGEDKQRLITRGALAWLKLLHNPDVLARFDVVEVLVDPTGQTKPQCEIVPNAFPLPEPYRYSAQS